MFYLNNKDESEKDFLIKREKRTLGKNFKDQKKFKILNTAHNWKLLPSLVF